MNAYIAAALIVQIAWLVTQFVSKNEETRKVAFLFNATLGGILFLGAMIRVLSNP